MLLRKSGKLLHGFVAPKPRGPGQVSFLRALGQVLEPHQPSEGELQGFLAVAAGFFRGFKGWPLELFAAPTEVKVEPDRVPRLPHLPVLVLLGQRRQEAFQAGLGATITGSRAGSVLFVHRSPAQVEGEIPRLDPAFLPEKLGE